MLTFWVICMSQTMDKYPELLYEELKGKILCLIRLGRMISHMATNLETTWKLATNTFTTLLSTQSS
jgi:hypothetical protein